MIGSSKIWPETCIRQEPEASTTSFLGWKQEAKTANCYWSSAAHSGHVSPIPSNNLRDRDRRRLRRNSERRIQARDVESELAGVRVGAVLHPAVLLALADGASLLQHRDGPAAPSRERRSPLLCHQHPARSCRKESFDRRLVPAGLHGAGDSKSLEPHLVHLFP